MSFSQKPIGNSVTTRLSDATRGHRICADYQAMTRNWARFLWHCFEKS